MSKGNRNSQNRRRKSKTAAQKRGRPPILPTSPRYWKSGLILVSAPKPSFLPTSALLYALERGGLDWRDVTLAENDLLIGKLRVVLQPV